MLTESNNRAAVDMAIKTGLKDIADMAKSLKLNAAQTPYPSIALGAPSRLFQ